VSSYVCQKHGKLMMAQVCPECLKALVAAAQRLRSELDPSSMADEVLYRLIDAALAPFKEAADGAGS